jgi:hypothetical protein
MRNEERTVQTQEETEAEITLEEALQSWFAHPEEERERALTLLGQFADESSNSADKCLLHSICRILRAVNVLDHV